MSTFLENIILRACSRYVKHFSRDNINVGVTGTINLNNIHLNSEDIEQFLLPYKLKKAFVGNVFVDIWSLEIRVSDALFILSKDDDEINESISLSTIQKCLQTWIGAIYLSLISSLESSRKKQMMKYGIDSMKKYLDRMHMRIVRLHIRIEDTIDSSNTKMSLGPHSEFDDRKIKTVSLFTKCDEIECRNPSQSELKTEHPWIEDLKGYDNSNSTNILKTAAIKVIFWRKLSVGFSSDKCLGSLHDSDLDSEVVKHLYENHRETTIISPLSFTVKFMANLEEGTSVICPIRLYVSFNAAIDVKVSEEQIVFILHIYNNYAKQIRNLQNSARAAAIRYAPAALRAKLRWSRIRDAIRRDWRLWARRLPGGLLRWRAWFQEWRLAARYVALRELLVYHVGFDIRHNSISDARASDYIVHNLYESLCEFHSDTVDTRDTSATGGEGRGSAAELYYPFVNEFSPRLVRAAETILSQQLLDKYSRTKSATATTPIESKSYPNTGSCYIDPLSLSPVAVHVLYALQLELDSYLSIQQCGLCRLWADERVELRYRATEAFQAASVSESVCTSADTSAAIVESPSADTSECQTSSLSPDATLLLAVIGASGLKRGMGSNKLEAYCSLHFKDWPGTRHVTTAIKSIKLSSDNLSNSAYWGDIFHIPLPPQHSDSSSGTYPSIEIDVKDKGLFTFTIGSVSVPADLLLSYDNNNSPVPNNNTQCGSGGSGDMKYSLEIKSTTVTTSQKSSSDSPVLALQLMTLLVDPAQRSRGGTARDLLQSMAFLRTTVADTISQLQQRDNHSDLVQRQDLNSQSKNQQSNGDRSGECADDESDSFILDPTQITIKDFQTTLIIPKLVITLGLTVNHELRQTLSSATALSGNSASTFVPILQLQTNKVKFTSKLQSNPWSVEAEGRIDRVVVSNLRSEISAAASAAATMEKPLEAYGPILRLPSVSVCVSLTQSSTMSRYIGGNLDLSCFSDWMATFKIYPFKISFRPSTVPSSRSYYYSSVKSIWRSSSLLGHLSANPVEWALNTSTSAIDTSVACSSHLRTESQLRLGDRYSAYPKFVNVLEEVLVGVRAEDTAQNLTGGSTSEAVKNKRVSQHTFMQFISMMRAAVVEVELDTDALELSNLQLTQERKDSELYDDKGDLIDRREDLIVTAPISTFMSSTADDSNEGSGGYTSQTSPSVMSYWFGGSSRKSTSMRSKPTSGIDGSSSVTPSLAEFEKKIRSEWEAEREKLRNKISQLEETRDELLDRVIQLSRNS